ncbi:MAG TPA: hypothetical protein PK020_19430 [Ilumatobacteraceae bacterium]|nr:hypothetical protein [Ilumatobacteraceae bacterium]
MSITIEQLATRLTAEAERRGITTETLIDELAARLDDPLEAFIGCAASGRTEPFEIQHERAEAAAKKFAQGI